MPDIGVSRVRPRALGRNGRAWLLALVVALFIAGPAAANPRYAALVIDAKTGATLFDRNADEPRFPASLTKMMTLYLLFEELEAGRLSLSTPLRVSAYAAGRPPTKLGLAVGSTIRVEDAIRALAVRSANDVAVVVAEHISGSVPAFAERMTRTARAIGMRRTTFRNPSGLPHAEQITTARDMALLARALQDRFPRYYGYFNTRSFTYGGRRLVNTNRLLGNVRGMDGIKTGYTRASGFNLVSHVERDGRSIIAVVMGGRSAQTRNNHMVELINANLPKASRGPRTAPLVSVQLMAPAPMPRVRPADEPPVGFAMAAVVRTPAAAAPVARVAHVVPAPRPEGEGDAAEASRAADPIAQRIARANEAVELAYAGAARADDETLAKLAAMAGSGAPPAAAASQAAGPQPAAPVPGGWHVQIAAVPDEAGARALLEQARSRAGNLLGSAEGFTQRVESKGTVFYRARFAGFAGKDEARSVCGQLKRRSIDCLALPQ